MKWWGFEKKSSELRLFGSLLDSCVPRGQNRFPARFLWSLTPPIDGSKVGSSAGANGGNKRSRESQHLTKKRGKEKRRRESPVRKTQGVFEELRGRSNMWDSEGWNGAVVSVCTLRGLQREHMSPRSEGPSEEWSPQTHRQTPTESHMLCLQEKAKVRFCKRRRCYFSGYQLVPTRLYLDISLSSRRLRHPSFPVKDRGNHG